jgi:hypothetical protein
MIAAIYARKSTDQAGVGPGRGARTREGEPDECGDRHDAGVLRLPGEAHPEGGVRGHAGPVFLQASGTTPHQVVLTCSLEIAEKLLEIARPQCGPAAEDIRIAIAEYRKSTGGA